VTATRFAETMPGNPAGAFSISLSSVPIHDFFTGAARFLHNDLPCEKNYTKSHS
jgi:hypothetical protein